MVVARSWEKGGMGSYCLMDRELLFGKIRVLEVDSSDGGTTTYVFNSIELYTRKWFKW